MPPFGIVSPGSRRQSPALHGPRVGCIEWLDPPFSAGHWVPEMVRLAGGRELFAGPGERSVRLDWPSVFGAAPEVLVLMPCGFDAIAGDRGGRGASEPTRMAGPSGREERPRVGGGRQLVFLAAGAAARGGRRDPGAHTASGNVPGQAGEERRLASLAGLRVTGRVGTAYSLDSFR